MILLLFLLLLVRGMIIEKGEECLYMHAGGAGAILRIPAPRIIKYYPILVVFVYIKCKSELIPCSIISSSSWPKLAAHTSNHTAVGLSDAAVQVTWPDQ